MYSNNHIPIWRYLLFPIAMLYGLVIYIRNFLFDKNILKTQKFDFPIICIGNISVGGTGKTPMTEMLISHLQPKYSVATLSRGYKRKTKGFIIANENTTASDIGDEPMQFHKHFPDTIVAVGEDRGKAIDLLLALATRPDIIILDDALQHRKVAASINVLLTDYSNLFYTDFFLPIGSLRDQRSSYHRADIIVVTKCPSDINLEDTRKIISGINPNAQQSIFFSKVCYGEPYNLFTNDILTLDSVKELVAIAGIAKPKPFFEYLKKSCQSITEIALPDHHDITEEDIDKIFSPYKRIENKKNVIFMITEKDAPRFLLFRDKLIGLTNAVYVLPIRSEILFGEVDVFYEKINSIITNGKLNEQKQTI